MRFNNKISKISQIYTRKTKTFKIFWIFFLGKGQNFIDEKNIHLFTGSGTFHLHACNSISHAHISYAHIKFHMSLIHWIKGESIILCPSLTTMCRVDMPMNENLKSKRRSNLHTLFLSFWSSKNICSPTPNTSNIKIFLIKEWGNMGAWCKGFTVPWWVN